MHRFWGWTFGSVLLGIFLLSAVSPWMNWWLPKGTSSYSPEIDKLFYLILAVVTFFYVLTEVLLVVNICRSGAPGRKAQFTHGSQKLELLWSVIPGVILVTLAVVQIQVWANIKYPSHMLQSFEKGEQYLQMGVEARQWEYRMRYPSPARVAEWESAAKAKEDFVRRLPERFDDVHVVNDVHVWKDQKVLIHLKTRDVGHSLFFPNLRLKQDALPGRTIPVWFEAKEANTQFNPASKTWTDGWRQEGSQWVSDPHNVFDLVCTQYCGTRHSLMRGKLYVHPTKEDFLAWLKQAQELNNDKKGTPTAVAANP